MTFARANIAADSWLAPHVVIAQTSDQWQVLLLVVRRRGTVIVLVQYVSDAGETARSGVWWLEDVRKTFPGDAVQIAEDNAIVLYR